FAYSPIFTLYITFSHLTHIRYLLSFPTRRSSDLLFFFLIFVFIELELIRFCLAVFLLDVHLRLFFLAVRLCIADFIWNRTIFQKDRKSTRLNSSHVKNSYAVFCFNKKKMIIIMSL